MILEQRWQQILTTALDGAAVERDKHGEGPDLLIRTRDGRTIAIEVKWAGEGWPQDVRQAAASVGGQWPANVVLLAHRLSPGAIEWLRERGANWADEAGQARILGPDGLIVVREPSLPAREDWASRPFRWTRSALSIGEQILAREDQALHATELATASDWSVPQAANVLKAFDGQGWTVKHGGLRGPRVYRELADPDGMLASWSVAVTEEPRRSRIAHRASRDVMALLRDGVAPALEGVRWGVSGWAGLELAAPYATTTPSIHIYVAEEDFAGPLTDAIERAGLREVDEGGRVTFWATDARVLKLASQLEEIPVVSAPRLYADLSSFTARGQDAADHMKEQLIDPLHRANDTAGDTSG